MTIDRTALLDQTFASIRRYLQTRHDQPIPPTPEGLAGLNQFDVPLPDQPVDEREVIRMLDEFGAPGTLATTCGRFFGFVIGGSLPVTTAAHLLAAAWDQTTGLQICSPVNGKLEEVAARWLVQLLGLPEDVETGFVTGATMANFTGLAAARHRMLANRGWNVEDDGLFGAPPLEVVVGDEAHSSLFSTLSMLGLGKKRVHRVPVDGQGRMRVDALPRTIEPAIVCLQAGNINTGDFDPADPLIDWAQEHDAWVHVDGAFGLWAAVRPELQERFAGFRRADSWATDAHKVLNTPYDCGLVFVRDRQALIASMNQRASYLKEVSRREPSHLVPELSRRARGMEVWAALYALGRQGVEDLVGRLCRHARRFARELSEAGYQVLNEVVFNQVMVSFGDAETTERVARRVREDGTCWVNTATWQGHTVVRISVCNWSTNDQDVTRSVAAMVAAAQSG